ncbi:hypothetical protein TOPH_05758 [Tolypocladium ophioglossoides CBS 100239]|uniref:Uncharacterized protein n=1 Tax=Tolypocladium ophioglossoides (strain CBS 100239) TaxID=1163406 RepID=A0A0L0N6F9_TOLOC|nr:hypothetical protein TOPH_05758 [Tolypocladium ophioglossoides CBS 100239]
MDASSRLSLAPETDEPSSESSYSPSSLTREGALLLIKVFGLRLASSMSMSSSDNTALGAGFGITTPGVGEIKGSSGRRPLLLAGRPGAALGAGDFPLLAGTRMVTGVRAGGGLLAPPKVYWGDSASSNVLQGHPRRRVGDEFPKATTKVSTLHQARQVRSLRRGIKLAGPCALNTRGSLGTVRRGYAVDARQLTCVIQLEGFVDPGAEGGIGLLFGHVWAGKRMHQSRVRGRNRGPVLPGSGARISDIDRLSALHGCFLVALEVTLMCYSTVVDKALGAREVLTVAVETDQLDGLSISSLQDAWASLVLGLGITIRQRLQLLPGAAADGSTLDSDCWLREAIPRRPTLGNGDTRPRVFGRELPFRLYPIKGGIRDEPFGVMAGVRSVDDAKWRCPSRHHFSRLICECWALSLANVEHLIGCGTALRIRDKVAPPQLLECDLALGQLLIY